MEQNEASVNSTPAPEKSPDALLAGALAKAQAKIQPPPKNKKVDFTDKNGRRVKYNYADLADCIAAVREPLSENGLAVTHSLGWFQSTPTSPSIYGLWSYLVHEGGGIRSSFYPLPDPEKQSIKPQEFGSALTYGRRYSLTALVGIASDDDDDGASAADTQKPAGNQQSNNKGAGKTHSKPVTKAALNYKRRELEELNGGGMNPEDLPQEFPPSLEEDFPGAFNAPPAPKDAAPHVPRAVAGANLTKAFNEKFILEKEQREILQRMVSKSRIQQLTTAEMLKVTEYVSKLTPNPNPNGGGR